jgi:uncharacterized repeat protein (TIGR03803 family)
MSFLHLRRYALGIVGAAAILTGCGAQSQPSIGAAGTTRLPGSEVLHVPAKGIIKTISTPMGGSYGANPWSGVIAFTRKEAPSGPRVIGTTLAGGDSNNDGVVYGFAPRKNGLWSESVLYTFQGAASGDGSEPVALYKEVDAATPKFFVTTLAGGANNEGTVEGFLYENHSFDHVFTYSFAGQPDGASPYGPVVADKAGNLYGTTSAGGTNNAGTVYRIQPEGSSSYTETVLYSFKSGSDGGQPYAGLIMDAKGGLYGTTVGGGSAGYGSVFKLTPSGSGSYTKSTLYSFLGPPHSAEPTGGLTAVGGGLALAAGGKVIGMASSGGNQGYGTVYELTSSSGSYQETVLWNFGGEGDGKTPYGSVLLDKQGVIYGTTYGGGRRGSSGFGTFFTLKNFSTGDSIEKVSAFTGTDGANPYAGPSCDSDGNLFGTASAGGKKNNNGTVVTFAATVKPCSGD